MNSLDFTVEEINFICIANADTREATISKVFEMLPDIDDKELLAVGESVVNKLGEMSDEDFSECHFNEMFSD